MGLKGFCQWGLDFARGFPKTAWALVGYVNWALCCRHENLTGSHRHNDGDEVFETWLPFPGLTKPTLGISKQIKRKSLDRDDLSRAKGNKGGDVISHTKQRNKLTKGELSQWNHLHEGGNRLMTDKRKEWLEKSCRGCQLRVLQGWKCHVFIYFVMPTGWIMERCQQKWVVE